MNINKLKSERGFTIVELLIVIVVIGILAAITMVSYNGIQNRSKTAAGQQLANSVSKKAQAWFTIQSEYPTHAEFTGNSGPEEAKLDDPSAVVDGAIASGTANGGKAVGYQECGTAGSASGARITYWDYTASAAVAVNVGTGVCPATP